MTITLQPFLRSSRVTFKESINMAKHHMPDDGQRRWRRILSRRIEGKEYIHTTTYPEGRHGLSFFFFLSFWFGASEWQVQVAGQVLGEGQAGADGKVPHIPPPASPSALTPCLLALLAWPVLALRQHGSNKAQWMFLYYAKGDWE